MRKFLATTAAGLALATGTVAIASFTPLASAQDAPTAQTQPAQGQDQGQGNGHRHIRRHAAKAAIKDAAGVIGISPQDLATALKSGQSVAQVATAHGVDPQTVINKLDADVNARIDKAVADGKITADRAAAMKTKVNDRVTKLVNHVFDGSHKPATK